MGFHPGKVETYVREPGNPWEPGLPKFLLPPSEGFKRLQFPARLAFAMTINEAQGQSLRVAGINLEQPCFSHGQLYVACSRVGSPERLFIFSSEGKTKNIVVYQKALL
ncbi:ATP-dependent DNA helicase pif1-like [Macrobrachium nipponense]|uniref:ATP-dependent DNA helicase pif1-like n=1 Tax=Macrobrachium nipponense TaxID=159736 RepID=UPI0030C7A720